MKNLLISILILPLFLSAQTDSLPLIFKTLDVKDLAENSFSDNMKMISASRSQKTVGELPLTTYIVTKEEIRDNGYTTLVDVLKTVPGIRVSQPGSAVEGETFMMRGLIGNQNTKILINDVPVKPTFLLGMPIGAQLPIRQAERIEIIFGPAGALYGSDASAGVINIILRESERPVFVNADLNFGSENYQSLNLLLGGKFGRNKNIVKFTGFGSYTQFDDRRIFYDSLEMHDFRNYRRDTLQFKNLVNNGFLPNFQAENENLKPVSREFSHISRLLGVNLSWRNFKFFYENMYRRDHSALGANPTAISISNPQTYTGETLNRYYLSWKKEGEKFSIQTLLNALVSDTDKFSSSNYNLNVFGNALLNEIWQSTQGMPVVRDSLLRVGQKEFLGGTRYKAATSLDRRLEQLVSYHPNENLEITTGASVSFNSAEFIDYAARPVDINTSIDNNVFSIEETSFAGIFGQIYYVSDKVNLIGALQGFKELVVTEDWQYSPRLAAIFKANKNLNIRASYGRGYRQGSPYYNFNTYYVQRNELTLTNASLGGFAGNEDLQLKPEVTNTYEAGINWKIPRIKSKTELIFFQSRTENLISFDQVPVIGSDQIFGVGYFNFKDTYAELKGIQFNLFSKNVIPRIGLNTRLSVQRVFGEELLSKGGIIEDVRGQPNWTIQFKNDMKLGKTIRLNLFHLYQSSFISRLVNNSAEFRDNQDSFTNNRYYTLDVMLLGKLTDNFQIHLRINNFFNKEYAGIDATGTPDDLLWNSQSLRWFTAGVSYQL